MKSLSHVGLFATPWTVAYEAPPSMEFSWQEYWSGLQERISKMKVMEINSRSPTEINRTQNVRLNCLCFKRNLTKRNKKLKATKTLSLIWSWGHWTMGDSQDIKKWTSTISESRWSSKPTRAVEMVPVSKGREAIPIRMVFCIFP